MRPVNFGEALQPGTGLFLNHEPNRSDPAPLAVRGSCFIGYTNLVVLVSRRYKIDKRSVEIDVV
jgi:hypothetical protein